MPLAAKAAFDENSDEEDDDYIPPADDGDSDSGQSREQDTSECQGTLTLFENPEEKKRARDALWASFQASVANPVQPPEANPREQKMVKIEKRHLFAGEDVIEVVEVPEDSEDAEKWPRFEDPGLADDQETLIPPVESMHKAGVKPIVLATVTAIATQKAPSDHILAVASSAAPPGKTTVPFEKRPGPRKPKTALAPLPGSSKPKKLTTLDKSAMDWRSHLQAEKASGSSIQDDLDANRRAGGYLEKVEFLKRVEGRKEENLDALRSNKRRRL